MRPMPLYEDVIEVMQAVETVRAAVPGVIPDQTR